MGEVKARGGGSGERSAEEGSVLVVVRVASQAYKEGEDARHVHRDDAAADHPERAKSVIPDDAGEDTRREKPRVQQPQLRESQQAADVLLVHRHLFWVHCPSEPGVDQVRLRPSVRVVGVFAVRVVPAVLGRPPQRRALVSAAADETKHKLEWTRGGEGPVCKIAMETEAHAYADVPHDGNRDQRQLLQRRRPVLCNDLPAEH